MAPEADCEAAGAGARLGEDWMTKRDGEAEVRRSPVRIVFVFFLFFVFCPGREETTEREVVSDKKKETAV